MFNLDIIQIKDDDGNVRIITIEDTVRIVIRQINALVLENDFLQAPSRPQLAFWFDST